MGTAQRKTTVKALKSIVLGLLLSLVAMEAAAKPLIYMPFDKDSSWYCVQAPGGSYSHTGNLQYSYDFNKGGGANNTSNPAFGQWVYSPVRGEVVKVVNNLTDFQYNDANHGSLNNSGYGNEVIIKAYKASSSYSDYYVRMLHFKKGSVKVKVGDKVEIGSTIAQIGQTGFSSGPHLHLHVSTSSSASVSVPFDFIEGPVKQGKWVKSDITPLSNAMDNNGSIAAGSHISYSSTVASGGCWSSSTGVPTYTGSEYKVCNSTGAPFKWKFKLSEPGYFMVMARSTAHANRDHRALYRIAGKQHFLDQREYVEDGWRVVGFATFNTPQFTYEISVESTTPNTYVVADAIDLIRIW